MSTRTLTYIVIAIAAFCTIPVSNASTITAASCSNSAIQTAINVAVDGDTVAVPPCSSVSWSSGVTIPESKGITLQGAGKDATIINIRGNQLIVRTALGNSPTRITGFRFSKTATQQSGALQITGRATNWRVDNNIFDSGGVVGGYWIRVGADDANTVSFTYGVIDNNQFINRNDDTSVFVEWGMGNDDPVATGDYVWGLQPQYGTAQAVYIEDNVFSDASGGPSASQVVDHRWGAKVVVRYNTIHNPWISSHSGCTNGGRDPIWIEYYENTLTDDAGAYGGGQIELRSVSGVVFGNNFSSTARKYTIQVDHERSGAADGANGCAGPYGRICNGSNAWDENVPGENGYRCLGQPGWGQPQLGNMSQAKFSGVFAFRNRSAGSLVNLVINNAASGGFTTNHLVFGREMFNESNMTIGPVANRPTTCNPGPMNRGVYVSNDENAQGYTIYVCTATNTWTRHWEPYTYPHPLRLGVVAPNPPQDLQ